jgi:hypothetical protein
MATACMVALAAGCTHSEERNEPGPAPSATTGSVGSAVGTPSAPAASVGSVTLKGPPPGEPLEPRVYAKSRFVWVRLAPGDKGWIGYLWFGASVKLRDTKPRYGAGCTRWYAIEPRGFVCLDGDQATLDPEDPVLPILRKYAPRLDSAWPHHYGESRGLPRYPRLPSRKKQRRREWDLEQHLERMARADGGRRHASLRGVDLTPAQQEPPRLEGLPPTLREDRKRLLPLSTVAYSTEAYHDQRSWLLTADLMWVPKDRVAMYPVVRFRGVELGKDARLPLAFFRESDRPQYRVEKSGQLTATDATFQRLSWVELTGNRREYKSDVYLETRLAGVYVKRTDAVVPKPRARTPWGAEVGSKDRTGRAPPGRATWLEASIWQGWLIAYEGTNPVYVTLISPGRGGSPVPGIDPLETASTPTGTFKITGKFATATMVAPGDYIHSDVPWTQNFHGPHALHGAYWHNDWGKRKSAGCVNVSPLDGRYLFHFTEPAVPEGWHGLRWRPGAEPATTFVIHR